MRKGISLHLQEIRIDYPRKRKAIISGSENKQLSWTSRETISEVERMDQMEDLKISRNFQRERNFISFQ